MPLTLPLNVNIRDYWNSDLDADGLINFGSDPMFDTATDADNTTNYLDKLHPRNPGYTRMSDLAAPVISAVAAAPGNRTVAPATWSPFDYSEFFTLSNGNRTIAWTTGGFNDAHARGFIGKSTGKWYWEMLLDNATNIGVGLVNYDYSMLYQGNKTPTNSDACLGAGYPQSDGSLYLNSVKLTTQPAFATNDVLQFAMDAAAKLFWYRKAGQDWNGNASANPVGTGGNPGVGGVSFAALGPGPFYPMGYIRSNGGIITSRFASGQMTGSVPSGYAALS